jgi:hypothetical protein
VLARIFSSLSSADLLRCALVSKVRVPVCAVCAGCRLIDCCERRSGWCWRRWRRGGRSWP